VSTDTIYYWNWPARFPDMTLTPLGMNATLSKYFNHVNRPMFSLLRVLKDRE
jgi:hypothetical protein